MDIRRKRVWLAVAGCSGVALLLLGQMLTQRPPSHQQTASVVRHDDSSLDEAIMQPLRRQANAALNELKNNGNQR